MNPESPLTESEHAWLDGVPVIARPSPFSMDRKAVTLPVGLTLQEIVDVTITEPWLREWACVAVDGLLVPRRMLSRVKPKAGKRVTITVVPRGGGGSSSGSKNSWAVVLSVVVILASVAAQQYYGVALGSALGFSTAPIAAGSTVSLASIYGGAIIGAVGMATLLAINALLPPPRAKLNDLGGGTRIYLSGPPVAA